MTDDAPLLRNAAGSARDRDPAEPVEAMALEQAIAVNVRHHRTAAGLSVADMAQRLGLSKAMLSKIENAQTSCSLATLQRLATGLDVPVTSLVRGADEERQAVFTPAGQGPRIARHGTKEGHEYELLGALRGQHKRLESLMVTLTEDSQTYPLFQHPGTEFLHVLEGRMVYGHGGLRGAPRNPARPHATVRRICAFAWGPTQTRTGERAAGGARICVRGRARTRGGQGQRATSKSPAAPIPPPTHIVTTTQRAPSRRPASSAWPTARDPVMP